MNDVDIDPWTRWYDAYRHHRAALRSARAQRRDRQRAVDLLAGLLVAYMLFGGLAASLVIGLVMAN